MVEKKRPEAKPKPPVKTAARSAAPKAARKVAAKPPAAAAAPKAPVKPKAAAKPKAAPKQEAPARERPLSVLMIAPEFRPYVRNGGLAQLTAALPEALGRLGHLVTLVLPKYHGIDVTGAETHSLRLGAWRPRAGRDLLHASRAGRRHDRFRGRAAPVRSRRLVRLGRERGPRPRLAVCALRPGRARVRPPSRGAAVRDPRARLAGRTGAGVPEDAPLRRPRRRRRAGRVHHPQPRRRKACFPPRRCPQSGWGGKCSTCRPSSTGDRSVI